MWKSMLKTNQSTTALVKLGVGNLKSPPKTLSFLRSAPQPFTLGSRVPQTQFEIPKFNPIPIIQMKF
jgi:hypothetical protein